MNANEHDFHKMIGEKIYNNFNENVEGKECQVILDHACGGKQRVPLFLSTEKSRRTELCNVDILILCNRKIKIIIEIEESDIKPTQICGKFLTSALATHYIHENNKNLESIEKDDNTMFIQIVDTKNLKKETSKYDQFKNIEEKIQSILSDMKDSRLSKYKIFYGTKKEFGNEKKKVELLMNCVKRFVESLSGL